MKICSRCGESKNLSQFGKQTAKPDGKRSACKQCMSAQEKITRSTSEFREKRRKYRRTPHVREKEKSYDDARRSTNEFKAKESIRAKEYRKINPHKKRESESRRRARMRNQLGFLPNGYEIIMEEAYSGRICHKCGYGQNIQVDHIVPSSLGGLWCLSNYQFLCLRCNVRKRNVHCTDYRTFDQIHTLLEKILEMENNEN